jgi:hypothetical protein
MYREDKKIVDVNYLKNIVIKRFHPIL